MHRSWIRYALAITLCSALFAQGTSDEARLRSLNAEILRLRGLLYGASEAQKAQIHSQGAPVLQQRQSLLEAFMASQPALALQLSFPADVLGDLAASFPQSAGRLESRGSWQGPLYYFVEDGVGFTRSRENRKLRVGGQLIDLFSPSPVVAGSKCNDVIAATGVRSNNKIVAESSTLVSSALSATCSPVGAQKIAAIMNDMLAANVKSSNARA